MCNLHCRKKSLICMLRTLHIFADHSSTHSKEVINYHIKNDVHGRKRMREHLESIKLLSHLVC